MLAWLSCRSRCGRNSEGNARGAVVLDETVRRPVGDVGAEIVVEAARHGSAADGLREDRFPRGAVLVSGDGRDTCGLWKRAARPAGIGQSQPRCHLPMQAVR